MNYSLAFIIKPSSVVICFNLRVTNRTDRRHGTGLLLSCIVRPETYLTYQCQSQPKLSQSQWESYELNQSMVRLIECFI